jgi:hypothetical protein
VVRCVWLKGEGEDLVQKFFHEAMEVNQIVYEKYPAE